MIKLDEWGGVPMDDPATCEMQLRNQLITPLSLADRYTSFHSDPSEPAAECKRISTWLEDNGPIDLCVLGLGTNGHLGFNEPADMLQPHAHVAQLSDSSLSHAMLSSTHRRPTFGLTLGMADLLNAHAILLLVSGPAKRGPFERLLKEEISTAFPASLLHLHPRVTVLCDVDACPSNA
jgi:galactosamine-6-phosphate isomerase